uniref:Putative LOV domain-containing protein n=1 Tax=Entransia fimbriata TaxID=130991 RepID=A0A126WVJ4_9VIRI|nr:putative LOV domain-containing protein [Entransia fimbriata]
MEKDSLWEALAEKSLCSCYDEKVAQLLQQHYEYNFVLTDPRLPDNPIVYASEGFCHMTGYTRDEVIGRNCRFLQGPDTCRRTVMMIRDAMREERACQVRILNYNKGGRPFWNLFHMAPIFSRETGALVHYVGVQTPISHALAETSPTAMELPAAEARMAGPCEVAAAATAVVEAEAAREDGAVRQQPKECCQGDAADQGPAPMSPGAVHRSTSAPSLGHPGGCVPSKVPQRSVSEPASPGLRPLKGVPRAVQGVLCPRSTQVSMKATVRVEEDDTLPLPEVSALAQTAVEAVLSDLTQSGGQETPCSGSESGTGNRVLEPPEGGAVSRVVCSSLLISLTRIQQSFVLADPNLPDMPIIHASDLFCQLTGYSLDEVVGRNCRFLQGPDTDPNAVAQLRSAIEAAKPCTVRLLNYRKDGTPFWNNLHLSPVRNAGGKVAFFVGVQLEVAASDKAPRVPEEHGLGAHLKQLGVVGAVRVAARALDRNKGLRRIQSTSR